MMGLSRLRFIATGLMIPVIASLTPRRPHSTSKCASSRTSLLVALEPPTLQVPIQIAHTKIDDKEAHEYRWLTWLYQHWKDVPYGKLDPDIVKQILPALTAYGRRQTSQSAEQAEELLDRYIEEYRAGNCVIPLENTAFHAVMNAYSKSAQPERSQKVLQKMIDLSRSEECFRHLQPDVFSFTILATAWARSRHPNAADKAGRLLHHMEHNGLHVTTLTYNVVLNAIAVSHDPHKASRAAKIVGKMQQLVARGHQHCQPDLYTYQSWIHACSRTRGGVPQTMEIFRFLDEQAALGNENLRPNAYCFAAAIHAWAYSSEPQKAIRAYELLQDMRQRYEIYGQQSCRPNVVVFTSVINACVKPATYKDKETAFEIAQLVFEELVLSTYGAPNFLTYAAFLHVCGTALDDENKRDSNVRRVFELCRRYGCVGKIVLQKLQVTASEELFLELMGPYETWDEIPTAWKRRVKGERFKSQAELDSASSVKNGEVEGMKPHKKCSKFATSTTKSLQMTRPSRPVSFHRADENRWEIKLL